MLSAIIGPLIGGIFGVIDKAVPDKDEAARIKSKLQEMVLTGQIKEIEAAAQIIVAEASGDSWLQRNWRPLLMCLFGLIVANNYVLAPYILLFMGIDIELGIPPDMWDLLKLGVGGYVLGRSVEKGVRVWKQPE
ncbi:MAG: hypothetical protein HN403_13475 [Rhodospirillales bacterium]|jgi:hypothetical protein|nr:hypothetical protein [Rhodospirillales bacterium]